MSPYSATARRLCSASVGIGGWVEPSSAVAPVKSGTSFCAPRANVSKTRSFSKWPSMIGHAVARSMPPASLES